MRRATVLAVVVLCLFAPAEMAVAHTDIDYSEPSSGSSTDEPVTEIVVAFTLPVTIVGKGFEVLSPSGEIVRPTVSSVDGKVFVLEMEEPLVGGDVGVRYEVAAADGHVLADGFSFTVTASAVSTTTTTNTRAATAPGPTSTVAVTTTVEATSTTTVLEETSASTLPWLIGVGLVLVMGLGIYVGVRSRLSR